MSRTTMFWAVWFVAATVAACGSSSDRERSRDAGGEPTDVGGAGGGGGASGSGGSSGAGNGAGGDTADASAGGGASGSGAASGAGGGVSGAGGGVSGAGGSAGSDPDGGLDPVLATGQNQPTGIALSSSEVYWASYADGTIVKCPKTGCGSAGPSVVVSNQPGLHGIALHGSTLYWATRDDAGTASTVMKCDVGACGSGTPAEPNPGPRGLFGPYGLAANSERLYVASWTELLSCPVGGCGADAATSHAASAGIINVALNASHVYFMRWGGASISRCAIDDCSGTETALITGAGMPLAFALDDENLYWSRYDLRGMNELGGTIRSCPIAGCDISTSRLLATGQIGAAGIAVDATDLYYTDHMNGQVVRLAKNSTADQCDPGVLLGCGSCGGLIRCDGTCTIATPPDLSMPCGECGGVIQCDGNCSNMCPPP